MQVILGASGQVGSAIVRNLLARGENVRAVVRQEKKAGPLQEMGAEVVLGDASDLSSLNKALEGAESLFVLTPEANAERPILELTQEIVANYRLAIDASGVRRVIALSSVGAQFDSGTGNLLMSHLLENALAGLSVSHAFVRPVYYFSNWLSALDSARKKNILPTFFPAAFQLSMIAPADVAAFCSWLLTSETGKGKIYALNGPVKYTPNDVAAAFSDSLGVPVKPAVIPRERWEESMQQMGMTADGVKKFIEMTESVISGKAVEADAAAIEETAKTTLKEYFTEMLASAKKRPEPVIS